MAGLVMAAQLILSLTLLVVIHEFGHFITAKMFGMRVSEFYVFFNPRFSIFKCKKIDGRWHFAFFTRNLAQSEAKSADSVWNRSPEHTEYGIGWLPLGGYCRIAGMIDESLDTEAMKRPPQAWEFRSKPAWQRLIVMLAGVVMNVIAAILILSFSHLYFSDKYLPMENITEGIYAYPYGRYLGFENGDKIVRIDDTYIERYEDMFTNLMFADEVYVERNGEIKVLEMTDTLYSFFRNGGELVAFHNFPMIVDSVVAGMTAQAAGLQRGDKLISVDGLPVSTFGHMREILQFNKGRQLQFVFQRGMAYDTLTLPVDAAGKIGVFVEMPQYTLRNYTFASSLKYGWIDAFASLSANIKGLGLIITGKEKAKDNLQGPIGIAKIYGGVWNWERFWRLTGLISIILAFMNVLPIPALDGGHALFLIIELITRRKLSDKAMSIVQMIGMALLLLLMIFVIGNDIINLF